jgi:hypothetical protein
MIDQHTDKKMFYTARMAPEDGSPGVWMSPASAAGGGVAMLAPAEAGQGA